MVQSVLTCFSAVVTKSAAEKEGFISSYSPALREVRKGAGGRNLAAGMAGKAIKGLGFLTCLQVLMQQSVLYNPGPHSQGCTTYSKALFPP